MEINKFFIGARNKSCCVDVNFRESTKYHVPKQIKSNDKQQMKIFNLQMSDFMKNNEFFIKGFLKKLS